MALCVPRIPIRRNIPSISEKFRPPSWSCRSQLIDERETNSVVSEDKVMMKRLPFGGKDGATRNDGITVGEHRTDGKGNRHAHRSVCCVSPVEENAISEASNF